MSELRKDRVFFVICRRTCILNKEEFVITEKKENTYKLNAKVKSLNYANCEINKCTEMQIAFVYLRGLKLQNTFKKYLFISVIPEIRCNFNLFCYSQNQNISKTSQNKDKNVHRFTIRGELLERKKEKRQKERQRKERDRKRETKRERERRERKKREKEKRERKERKKERQKHDMKSVTLVKIMELQDSPGRIKKGNLIQFIKVQDQLAKNQTGNCDLCLTLPLDFLPLFYDVNE